MDNKIEIFKNEQFGEIRTALIENEPWFVAVDVCRALEIGNSSQAISRLDADEKMITLISNEGNKRGNPNMTVVNEPGLYTLILSSRKPEAKAFKRWIEVKTVEVKSPVVTMSEETAQAPKAHRLTAEEKEIKAAVMDTLKGQIAYNNDGMRASYRASNHSFNLLARNGVRIEGNTVTQNGEPLFKIHRRHAARKTQGCYRELLPTLEYVKQEQKQEKPSIRDQLKAAAKQQPEKKLPVKSKTHDMEL